MLCGAHMRLPRIRKQRQKQEFDDEDFGEEEEFWDIRQELQAANVDIEEMDEEELAAYSDTLLSEPDENCQKIARGKEYVLPEFHMPHEEKKTVEQNTFGGGEENLKEKNWEKQASESLDGIRSYIDTGQLAEKTVEEEEPKDIYAGVNSVSLGEPADLMHAHPISGTIINREIIYDTDGGFVVKVIYKEDDQVKTSYYSVSKVEGIEQALDDLSSYKPIIEDYPTHKPTRESSRLASQPTKEGTEKKSLLDTFFGKK